MNPFDRLPIHLRDECKELIQEINRTVKPILDGGDLTEIVCHFSCGAASAVATKLVLVDHPNAHVVYADPGAEHEDNIRFRQDCEKWFGKTVTVVRSEKYANPMEVCRERKYISGIQGAPCTGELKRIPIEKWMYEAVDGVPLEVLGYTVEEQDRANRLIKNNLDRKIWPVLIERGLTKEDCMAMVLRAGIELPEMYHFGYENNNCIGCVKARSFSYWNRIRRTHPEVFNAMAKLERDIGHAINREVGQDGNMWPVFLDELDAERGRGDPMPNWSCGIFCEIESQKLTSVERTEAA